MNKYIFILTTLLYSASYSQNLNYRTTFFDTKNITNLEIIERNTNNPSGGNDSAFSNLQLRKINDTEFIAQYINFNKGENSIYNQNTVINNPLRFKIVKDKLTILTNLDSLQHKLRKAISLQIGNDTSSFGEYFYMMYNPNLFIESTYMEYLKIFRDRKSVV